MTTNVVSAKEVSHHAARLNGAMGAMQLMVGVAIGNIGFIGESAHNIGDAVSFEAKARAIGNGETATKKSARLRLLAAGVFGAGAVGSVVGGTYELAADRMEHASSATICIAGISAAINSVIAHRTHKAVINDKESNNPDCGHGCHGHNHSEPGDQVGFGAALDSRLHAMTDSGTGWLYTAGLLLQSRGYGDYWGAASVLVNGVISSMSAGFMFNRLRKDTRH